MPSRRYSDGIHEEAPAGVYRSHHADTGIDILLKLHRSADIIGIKQPADV
jgi:hypothetical protein